MIMNESFKIISAESLSHDIALIKGENGIALSKNGFLADQYLKNFNTPHYIEELTLIIIRKGNARLKINLDEISISENNIVILMPNYILEMLQYDEDLTADILLFNYDVISELPLTKEFANINELINTNPTVSLEITELQELYALYSLLAYHCERSGTLQNEISSNILYALCYLIFQFYQEHLTSENTSTKSTDVIYKKFFSLLFLHYKKERGIQFYAESLNITSKYFSKIIKQISKKNASDIIDEMVIMGIKASLKCTDQTVLQISEEFNFPNPSFFGTYFKKRTGLTPSKYRIHEK